MRDGQARACYSIQCRTVPWYWDAYLLSPVPYSSLFPLLCAEAGPMWPQRISVSSLSRHRRQQQQPGAAAAGANRVELRHWND